MRHSPNNLKQADVTPALPQGSILGPLLFNVYLSDLLLFTEKSDIANYADVIKQLEKDSRTLLEWVVNNILKANPDKFHLSLSNTDQNFSVNVDQYGISNSNYEKLLGVTIDNKLKFDKHVLGRCKKAIMNAFINCPSECSTVVCCIYKVIKGLSPEIMNKGLSPSVSTERI